MQLSTKHANQQVVRRYDFSGGLNTSAALENIADNQLSQVVNMEYDDVTGCLRTVAGTVGVYEFVGKDEGNDGKAHEYVGTVANKTRYVYTMRGEAEELDFSANLGVGVLLEQVVNVAMPGLDDLLADTAAPPAAPTIPDAVIAPDDEPQPDPSDEEPEEEEVPKLKAVLYDGINKLFLFVDKDNTLYAGDLNRCDPIGQLSGELYPVAADWEDGTLIASGGKLQYFNGQGLVTITQAPEQCESVYVRAGRIVVSDLATGLIRFSAVGDEEDWTESSGDDSKSKFVEIGYKDGGHVIGMANLSQNMIIIKDNKRVYRLSGEYPDWVIDEVSRNIECTNRLGYCSIVSDMLILGRQEVQALVPSAYSSNTYVKPQNVAGNIPEEIAALPQDAKVRYVPPLTQVWVIAGTKRVLVYDVARQAWLVRVFNSRVFDVISVGDNVYLVRGHGLTMLDGSTFYDEGKALSWRFTARRMVSHNDFLLKRLQVSIVPLTSDIYMGYVQAGGVAIPLPIPDIFLKVYHNRSKIYKNKIKIKLSGRNLGKYASSDRVHSNPESVYGNQTPIFSRKRAIIKESRNVYRNKHLDLFGRGTQGGFLLSNIVMDIVEV